MRRDQKLVCPSYEAFVRAQPCLVHDGRKADGHHLVAVGWRRGRENSFTMVPLCRECHSEYHQHGREIFELAHAVNLWEEAFWRLLEHALLGMAGVERGKIT